MPDVNFLAVFAATLATFVIGGIWYSPIMFAAAWQREAAITESQLESRNMLTVFVGSFILMFIASFVFAMFLGPAPSILFGAGAGIAAGLFWVAGGLGVIYLFEGRSLRLWLINGGYNAVAFTVIGTTIGAVA